MDWTIADLLSGDVSVSDLASSVKDAASAATGVQNLIGATQTATVPVGSKPVPSPSAATMPGLLPGMSMGTVVAGASALVIVAALAFWPRGR